jgi:hypothetical protein
MQPPHRVDVHYHIIPEPYVERLNARGIEGFEWPVHTTRAVMSLLCGGRLARYPNIRYILAHGGGTVPILAHRIVAWAGADATRFVPTDSEPPAGAN